MDQAGKRMIQNDEDWKKKLNELEQYQLELNVAKADLEFA